MYLWNWWNTTLVCLVRGRIFGRRTSSIAPKLSSNDLQYMIGSSENTSKQNVLISLINPISGIKYLNDCDSKTYSAYLEYRAMTVWSLKYHTIGYSVYIITYPDHDFSVDRSLLMVAYTIYHIILRQYTLRRTWHGLDIKSTCCRGLHGGIQKCVWW